MNTSDEEFNSLLESIDGANFSVEDFADRMAEAGYPLEEMKAKMEALSISGEEFDRALLLSQGNAETFSQALYDVAEKGTTYEEIPCRRAPHPLDRLCVVCGSQGWEHCPYL